MAPRKTRTSASPKPPTELKTFKWEPRYSDQAGPSPENGAWVTLDPQPDFGSYTPEKSHVYFYPVSPQGTKNAYPLEWSSYLSSAQADLGNRITGDERMDWDDVTVDYDKQTVTFAKAIKVAPPPPPGPFEDSDERRAVIRRHASAIRKAAEAMLAFEDQQEAAVAIGYVYDGNAETVRIDLSTDIEEAVAEAKSKMDKARGLHDAVKNLTDEDRKNVLRHLAHMFSIDKGLTSLR